MGVVSEREIPDGNGVWTMTDAEFRRELADAFDAGRLSARRHAERVIAAANMGRPELAGSPSPNPYRDDYKPSALTTRFWGPLAYRRPE